MKCLRSNYTHVDLRVGASGTSGASGASGASGISSEESDFTEDDKELFRTLSTFGADEEMVQLTGDLTLLVNERMKG